MTMNRLQKVHDLVDKSPLCRDRFAPHAKENSSNKNEQKSLKNDDAIIGCLVEKRHRNPDLQKTDTSLEERAVNSRREDTLEISQPARLGLLSCGVAH